MLRQKWISICVAEKWTEVAKLRLFIFATSLREYFIWLFVVSTQKEVYISLNCRLFFYAFLLAFSLKYSLFYTLTFWQNLKCIQFFRVKDTNLGFFEEKRQSFRSAPSWIWSTKKAYLSAALLTFRAEKGNI